MWLRVPLVAVVLQQHRSRHVDLVRHCCPRRRVRPHAHSHPVRRGDAMPAVASPPVAPAKPAIARVMSNRLFEPIAVVIVLMLGLFAIPDFFDSFWIANFTQMGVYSIVAASAGL